MVIEVELEIEIEIETEIERERSVVQLVYSTSCDMLHTVKLRRHCLLCVAKTIKPSIMSIDTACH